MVTPLSAAIGAVGTLAGSALSFIGNNSNANKVEQGQLDTNKTNLQIARETNDLNLQLAEKQNQWNIEQWNRENEYNSPVHQMELYKAAGLNPALSQGSFVAANNIQSANLANQQLPQPLENPAAVAAPYRSAAAENLKSVAKDAVDTARSLYELDKVRAQTHQVRTLTPLQAEETCGRIQDLVNKNKWYDKMSDAQVKYYMEQANVLRHTIPVLDSEKQVNEIRAALDKFDLDLKEYAKDILYKMPQAEYDRIMSQIASLKATAANAGSQAQLNAQLYQFFQSNPEQLSKHGGIDSVLLDIVNQITDNGKKPILPAIIDLFDSVGKNRKWNWLKMDYENVETSEDAAPAGAEIGGISDKLK